MSIQSIVADVLQTHVLTYRQQRHINTLLLKGYFADSDFEALHLLHTAIASGAVVSGGDSIVPVRVG